MNLESFDAGLFLRDYWQKRPLLIRNAWQSWRNPLEPDELAGLACADDVEARLVTRKRHTWKVEHGPFPTSRFAKPGKKPWTLLVQAVDHAEPDVAALLEAFRFIPNWRVDDVMVSYATDGGGVGPHYDQYDVFLIQGLGKRRWQVGGLCDGATELLPHDDLRLLASFDVVEEWILEPGDILYIPPRIAHDGTAVGDDCMTYSIGFRAPSRGELTAHWCDHLLAEMAEDDRYSDPDLAVQGNPGEISPQAVAQLHAMITETMLDGDAFARWFGAYNSAPKDPDVDLQPEKPISIDQLRGSLAKGMTLRRNPASRFSFIRQGAKTLLFADGQCFDCTDGTAAFAESLCAKERFVIDPELASSASAIALATSLFNQGSVTFDADN